MYAHTRSIEAGEHDKTLEAAATFHATFHSFFIFVVDVVVAAIVLMLM